MLAMYTVYLQHFSYSCLTTLGGESTRFAPRLLAFSIPILACIQSSVRVLSYSFSKHCRAAGALLLLVFNLLFFDSNARIPTEIVFVPTEIISLPTEIVFAPTEIISLPTGIVFAPTEIISLPTEIVFAPTEIISLPTEIVFVPTEIISLPTGIVFAPTEIVSLPVEAMYTPTGRRSSPCNILSVYRSINKTIYTNWQMHAFVSCLVSQRYKLPRPFV